jgi:hypothetical protein
MIFFRSKLFICNIQMYSIYKNANYIYGFMYETFHSHVVHLCEM